jgi:MoxR-like ATPase
MGSQTDAWMSWLENIEVGQQRALYEVLTSRFSQQDDDSIRVIRTPIEDLMIEDPPVYVDIFNLHEIYKRLAFNTNIILKGPKGDGKTLSIFAYAASISCPLVIQECSEETKKYDLMGSQMFIGDETVYMLGSVPTAIDIANEVGQCILLFEELNALMPQTQKQLNAISDFRKMVSMPHIGKSYKLREDAKVWVVGTQNPSTYGGSYDMNEDLKSRFEEIELTYPEHGQEKGIVKAVCGTLAADDLIDKVLRFAKETRQQATGYALSTRDVNRFIHTAAKIGLDNALQLVIGKFEDADKDTVMKRMASVFGPKAVKKFWGAL